MSEEEVYPPTFSPVGSSCFIVLLCIFLKKSFIFILVIFIEKKIFFKREKILLSCQAYSNSLLMSEY